MLLQTVRSEKPRVAEDMSPTSTESQPRLLNLSPRHVQKEYLLDMSPTPTKRVAIYARVSTFDKGQDPETQLRVYAKSPSKVEHFCLLYRQNR